MSAENIVVSPAGAPAVAAPKPLWARILDSRYTPPVFITLILVVGHFTYGILESFERTALAIGVAIAVEVVLGKLLVGRVPNLASAYISGISVGILVRSPLFWPYALCAALSIGSKYVLRVKGRHIWNPSNFGISALLFLAPFAVASLSIQWGNNLYPMLVIWALGAMIIARLRRFHICLTYVLSFFALAYVRHLVTGDAYSAEIAPITGPMYQLFTFFMITDPKTTVKSKTGQCVVAFLVAFAEMLLRLDQNVHAPYYALFIVGPLALLAEMWWTSRKASASASAGVAIG